MRIAVAAVGMTSVLALVGARAHAGEKQPPEWLHPAHYVVLLQQSRRKEDRAAAARIEGGPAALEEMMDAAKAAGIDFDADRKPADAARDAAADYDRLSEILRTRPLQPAENAAVASTAGSARPDGATAAAVRRLLESRRDVFDLLHHAADKPECSFPIGELFVRLTGRGASMRYLARLLAAESRLLAEDGKTEEALGACSHIFHLAEHQASDTSVIGYSVASAIHDLGRVAVRRVVEARLNQRNAELGVSVLRGNRPGFTLTRALMGEVVLTQRAMQPFRALRTRRDTEEILRPRGVKPAKDGAPGVTWTDADRAAWNRIADAAEADGIRRGLELVALSRLPYQERRERVEQLKDPEPGAGSNAVERLSSLVSFTGRGLLVTEELHRARFACEIAGLSVLAYRARTGKLPEALEGATTEPPADPFNGGPLRYRAEGAGAFVVWCATPQLKHPDRPPAQRQLGSVSFRYPEIETAVSGR